MPERACKPGFVESDHFSRTAIACRLVQPTRTSDGPDESVPASEEAGSVLLGLAPSGVYRAGPVTRPAGALLPHRFTLATHPVDFSRSGETGRAVRRSVLCGTFPGFAAGGDYPPPCPVEPGLSSTGLTEVIRPRSLSPLRHLHSTASTPGWSKPGPSKPVARDRLGESVRANEDRSWPSVSVAKRRTD